MESIFTMDRVDYKEYSKKQSEKYGLKKHLKDMM